MPVFLRAFPLKDDSASAPQDQHNLIRQATTTVGSVSNGLPRKVAGRIGHPGLMSLLRLTMAAEKTARARIGADFWRAQAALIL
jgi:hypothetical protein